MQFGLFAQSFAPNPDWRFENFNSQNHFISRGIADLTMDKHGYIWTCSDGVQRFDGYKTIDFNSFDQAKSGLRGNYTSIIADHNGRIWVCSLGICYYDDTRGKFIYLKPDSNRNNLNANSFCLQKNYLWFVGDYGLAKLNLQSLKVSYTSLSSVTDPLCTYLIDENTLLVSSREKVYTYNIKKDTYTVNTLTYNHALVKIFSINKTGNQILLGTNNGLFSFNNLKDLSLVSNEIKGFVINDLLYLPQDKEKKYLFLATEGQGIIVYNNALKKIEFKYVHDGNNPYSLPNNIVSRFYIDKKERLWLSTTLGISMLDVFNPQLKMRFLNKSNTDELGINKIARDKYDSTRVWMSSYNLGMICIDWKTKKLEKVLDANPETQAIYDFVQLSKSRWLLATQKKIIEWNPERGIISEKKLPVPDSLDLVCNIRRIITADANTFYVTTNRGLFKYDLVTHKINIVTHNNMSDKSYNRLKYILLNGFYDNGILWAASRDGLFSYNTKTNETNVYTGKGGRSDYFFFDITKAPNNQIICAAGSGITIFDKQTKTFKVINTIANLYRPACENIITIKNKVWIGTEVGILNYNLDTHTSARAEHETSMMQIYPSSSFTIMGNDIVFGFRNGYAYFTENLNNNLVPSDPLIERVYVNNQPVLLPFSAQKKVEKLIFSHSDNSININFTAFLYSDPDHINFRYKLKGADPRWQYTEDQRNANYAQLPPGDYTFYVQCGNKNGVWNNNLAYFNFIITPPFWATWWFRILVILVIALFLYQLYLYKINHIKAIEGIRERIASDFHDDLGSTLSSISIFSEVAVKKAETDLATTKSMVGDIGVRARAMIHSMNDMVWIIKPENDNLYRLMQRMEEFGYPVAEAKEINLVFLMDESLYDIKTDMLRRKNLFLIFKEAFNNAVKYSNADSIEVRFELKQKKLLMMQIADNGCGFEYENRKRGNGIGNIEKRATEIKGKLSIKTTVNEGTFISIVCKIT